MPNFRNKKLLLSILIIFLLSLEKHLFAQELPPQINLALSHLKVTSEGLFIQAKVTFTEAERPREDTQFKASFVVEEFDSLSPSSSNQYLKYPAIHLIKLGSLNRDYLLEQNIFNIPESGNIFLSIENLKTHDSKSYAFGSIVKLKQEMTGYSYTKLPQIKEIPSIENNSSTANISTGMGLLSTPSSVTSPTNGLRNTNEYVFEKMSFKFKSVDPELESATLRNVRFGINTCIKDPLLFEAVAYRKLKIETYKKIVNESQYFNRQFDSEPLEVLYPEATDAHGCFSFNDSLTFDWYDSQRTYIKAFRITDLETGATSLQAAVVMPWNTGWIFAQDIRQVEKSELSNRSSYRPKVFMDSFRVNDLDVSYRVDNQLKLHLIKRFNLITTPSVTRFDSLTNGSFGQHPLKGGFYLFNLVLAKKNENRPIEVKDYVTSSQQIVSIRNGHIATTVELSIDDLTLMSVRNYVLVQILPINQSSLSFLPGQEDIPLLDRKVDQEMSLAHPDLVDVKSNLVSPTFEGPFIPLHLWQSPGLMESAEMDALKLIKEGKAYRKNTVLSQIHPHQISNYEKYNRLKSLFLDKEADINYLLQDHIFEPSDLENSWGKLIESETSNPSVEKELQRKLCQFWPNLFLTEKMRAIHIRKGSTPSLGDQLLFRKVVHKFHIQCLQALSRGENYFQLDRQFLTLKVRPSDQTYMGGLSFNFGVGSNFNFSKSQYRDVRKSETNSLTFSAGVKTSDLIPFMDIGLSTNESWSSSDALGFSNSNSSSLSYNSAAYLVIQNSVIRFWLDRYQRCLVVTPKTLATVHLLKSSPTEDIRFNKNIGKALEPPKKRSYLNWFNSQFKELRTRETIEELYPRNEQLDLLESGIRVCLPQSEEPIEVSESYYYVTQHFVTGDMQDAASRKNKPWLLSIRSNRDFKVFIQAINKYNELQKVGNLNQLPTDHLIKSYAYYNNQLPSWPSILNVEATQAYREKGCDNEVTFPNRIMNSVLDFFQGPGGSWKGDSSLLFDQGNFWVNYFCGVE